MSSTLDLTLIDAGPQALAEATTIEEVAETHNRFSTVLTYIQKKLGKRSEEARQVGEWILRAKRKLGELTDKVPQHPTHGGRPKKTTDNVSVVSKKQVLASVGINNVDASRNEAIARIPPKVFEQEVKKPNASTAKLVKVGREYAPNNNPPKPKPFDAEAVALRISRAISDELNKWPAGVSYWPLIAALQQSLQDIEFSEQEQK